MFLTYLGGLIGKASCKLQIKKHDIFGIKIWQFRQNKSKKQKNKDNFLDILRRFLSIKSQIYRIICHLFKIIMCLWGNYNPKTQKNQDVFLTYRGIFFRIISSLFKIIMCLWRNYNPNTRKNQVVFSKY